MPPIPFFQSAAKDLLLLIALIGMHMLLYLREQAYEVPHIVETAFGVMLMDHKIRRATNQQLLRTLLRGSIVASLSMLVRQVMGKHAVKHLIIHSAAAHTQSHYCAYNHNTGHTQEHRSPFPSFPLFAQ